MIVKQTIERARPYPLLNRVRSSRLLWILPRIFSATRYYNRFYPEIIRWGFRSNETTNYTYELTDVNRRYLAHTVAVVCGTSYEAIVGYMSEVEHDAYLLAFVAAETQRSPFRRHADSKCAFGRRVGWYAFARALKPRLVVETGVDKGLGAVLLSSAILRNRAEGHAGRYVGTDIDPDAGFLLTGKYRDGGGVIYGDSIETLKGLAGPIDLFVNDSDHSADYEYREYMTIESKLSKDAILLGDNSHASDSLARFSAERGRGFLFFREVPKDHWYPGAGIGISFSQGGPRDLVRREFLSPTGLHDLRVDD